MTTLRTILFCTILLSPMGSAALAQGQNIWTQQTIKGGSNSLPPGLSRPSPTPMTGTITDPNTGEEVRYETTRTGKIKFHYPDGKVVIYTPLTGKAKVIKPKG